MIPILDKNDIVAKFLKYGLWVNGDKTMKRELVLKNHIWLSVAEAITVTLGALIILGTSLLGYCLSEGKFDETATIISIVLGGIIAFAWIMFLISLIFSKKVIVSDEGIKAERFGKIVWSFKKEDIWECFYKELTLRYLLLLPILSMGSPVTNGVLFIRLHNGKISRHQCILTKRQVNKIKQNFDYPFKNEPALFD